MDIELAAVVAAVFVATIVYAVGGFGFALVAVPLLSILVDPRFAVMATTALGLPLGASIIVRDRQHIQWAPVCRIITLSLPGYPLGLVVLTQVNTRVLNLLIGLAVLVFALAQLREITFRATPSVVATSGFVSGILATSTGMNGPPIVVVLHSLELDQRQFRVSVAVVLLASKAVALLAFGTSGALTGSILTALAPAVPACIAGLVLGERIFSRASPSRLRSVVLGLLILSGFAAILHGLV